MSLLLRWVRMHALTQQQNGAVFSSLSLRVQKQKLLFRTLFIVFDVEIQDPVCQQMRSIQQNLLQNVSGIISALTLRESGLSYFLRSDSESFEVEKAVESE